MTDTQNTPIPYPATEVFANLKSVTFQLFFVIGFLQLTTSVMFTSQIATKLSWLLSRLLDGPFVLVTCLYLASTIRESIHPHKTNFTLLDTVLIMTGLLLFIGVFSYDLIFPNLLPQ